MGTSNPHRLSGLPHTPLRTYCCVSAATITTAAMLPWREMPAACVVIYEGASVELYVAQHHAHRGQPGQPGYNTCAVALLFSCSATYDGYVSPIRLTHSTRRINSSISSFDMDTYIYRYVCAV